MRTVTVAEIYAENVSDDDDKNNPVSKPNRAQTEKA